MSTPAAPTAALKQPQSTLYGAPELKSVAQKFLMRALIIAIIAHGVVIGGIKVYNYIMAKREKERPVVLAKFKVLAPPPSLSKTPPPQAVATQQIAPPSVGVPMPVPDAEAPKEQTIATQQEIQSFNPNATDTGSGDQLVIAAPQEDETPKIGEFVYYEDPPTLVSMPKPDYPELARDAQLEGTVKVQALIGKDGSVKKTVVTKSVNLLDDSAIKAVASSRWKPAMNNNKPVEVWVEVPVKFSLN